MADLLISLISKIATFPFTKRLIETLRPIVRQSKTRRDAFRSEISSLPTDEEMARVWFTRANSLPMPIGIGLGLEWAGGEYSEDGAFRRNALARMSRVMENWPLSVTRNCPLVG
ncbi:hypothetical protein [Bradyrhizobium frederickii]|uniref:hypothetical protein n=1 Tax=Bradyrhizobium frederickii TaxID=2560054 RepID=UPI001431C90A|nr:hypothetical protein [Bradyrhizobium frederickii]